MSSVLNGTTYIQYADDTTIYQHCKVKDKEHRKTRIQEEITNLLNLSTNATGRQTHIQLPREILSFLQESKNVIFSLSLYLPKYLFL